MAKVKLDKILEACETLVLKTNVAILEEASVSGLSESDIAKSRLIIHENIKYIKGQLIQGGILESAQTMLAENWVGAIMEDMSLSDVVDQGRQYIPGMEDDGMSAGQMVGAGLAAAGAAGAGIRYGVPAVQAGYKANVNSGANATGTMMAAKQALNGQIQNDINAVQAGVNHATLAGANIAADASQAGRRMAFDAGRQVSSAANQAGQAVKQGVADQVGATTAGFAGIQGPTKPGTGAAYKVGSMAGKVRRAFK